MQYDSEEGAVNMQIVRNLFDDPRHLHLPAVHAQIMGSDYELREGDPMGDFEPHSDSLSQGVSSTGARGWQM